MIELNMIDFVGHTSLLVNLYLYKIDPFWRYGTISISYNHCVDNSIGISGTIEESRPVQAEL